MNSKDKTRRQVIGRSAAGIGTAALASLLNPKIFGDTRSASADAAMPQGTDFRPKAKRVIYLFMHGGPSQIELFDHKPQLRKRHGSQLPDGIS